MNLSRNPIKYHDGLIANIKLIIARYERASPEFERRPTFIAKAPLMTKAKSQDLIEKLREFTTCGCEDERWSALRRALLDTLEHQAAENGRMREALEAIVREDDQTAAWCRGRARAALGNQKEQG